MTFQAASHRIVAIALLWCLDVLVLVTVSLDGRAPHRAVAALAVAIVTWALATPARRGRVLVGVVASFVAYAAFLHHVHVVPEPIPHRLLHVGVLYSGAATALAGLLGLIFPASAAGWLVAAISLSLSLVVAERLIEGTRYGVTRGDLRWVGGTVPHPILEDAYAPHSVARTLYPDDRRHYFRTTDPVSAAWALSTQGGARAELAPPDPSGTVRVGIHEVRGTVTWHVQLSHAGLSLKQGQRYRVRFRARADRPRTIAYGVSQAHEPWEGLGWYREAGVGPEWSEHDETFVAIASESQARMTWDLGADAAAVELTAFSATLAESDATALRYPPPEYFVEYKFNARGCRGPDYEVPAPPGRHRVLAIGDSFTMGVGVHEEHTFSRQLQDRLNAAKTPGADYEVINCGVSGYSTRQERLQFELLAPIYQPDLVLLTMVFNDDIGWREELRDPRFRRETRYERLALLWNLTSPRSALREPVSDFANTTRELHALREAVSRSGAKLVVVIFRHTFVTPAWAALKQAVAAALSGTDVPWMDLGDELTAAHDWRTLLVHRVDGHPNEIAHDFAAGQIHSLLKQHHLVP
jgi:lysophospholipase L1-like esterase